MLWLTLSLAANAWAFASSAVRWEMNTGIVNFFE